jgi:hypothetical protein
VEWTAGEVAGALAAYCLDRDVSPQQVAGTRSLVEEFQARLHADGVELYWPEHPGVRAY